MTAEKPEIDFPDGPPPTELEVTELTEGDGAEATAGSTVSVHYVGVAHSTGEEFDASYNRGEPLDFRLGVGQVISGWDQGVQGMKVGGRRRLVIPPHLGVRRPRRRRRDQARRDADLRGGPRRRPLRLRIPGARDTAWTGDATPAGAGSRQHVRSPSRRRRAPRAAQRDHVAVDQLAAAPGLDLAVDGDQALDHQLLGVGAGVDQVGELEELTQPDRLVADRHVVALTCTVASCGGIRRTSETAWMSTPTRPPTMVPLIRMNCRSRPTCSSILRAASLPSQRSMVCGDDRGQLVAVPPDREDREVGAAAVQPARAAPSSRPTPLPEGHQLASGRGAQRAVGVVERLQQRRAEGAPQRHRGDHHLRVLEHPVLEPLGALLGRRVVRAGRGRAGASRLSRALPGVVVGVAADVVDPADRLEVQPGGDPVVDRGRRPPGRPLPDDLDERLLVVHQPAVRLLERQVDQPVVRAVGDDLLQQAAGDRAIGSARNRGSSTSSTSEATSSSRSRGSPIAATVAALVDHPAGVAPSPTHAPTRRASRRPSSRSRMTASCRKFSPTNSSRLRPSSSLRRGISAVCGIGSPSGCLNSAVTANQSAIAPTMVASAPALTKPRNPSWSSVSDVDDGGEQQQPDRDRLHPAQPRTPLLVRLGVGSHQGR